MLKGIIELIKISIDGIIGIYTHPIVLPIVTLPLIISLINVAGNRRRRR